MPDANLTTYDNLLADDGPAAIIFEQWLRPVEGDIVFPPTYANPSQKKGDPPVYDINEGFFEGRQVKICTIDSVQSQANRMEPALGEVAGGKLVPKVLVKAKQEIGGEKEDVQVDLLLAGHRAADALVRFSPEIRKKVTAGFAAIERSRNYEPMAKLNPTALVFGVWDSRESGVKVPRLINSVIRAYDVVKLERSAQYFPALKYDEAGVASEEKLEKASTEGMAEVPAHGLGGVQVRGGICRRGSLNLVTLRGLTASDAEATKKLQRYILGLALVALTYHDGKCLNLRQGCQLVLDKERKARRWTVMADGKDNDFSLTVEDALAYAVAAAEAFGVGQNVTDTFKPDLAKKALTKKGKDGVENS